MHTITSVLQVGVLQKAAEYADDMLTRAESTVEKAFDSTADTIVGAVGDAAKSVKLPPNLQSKVDMVRIT
jgi:hypothetical protein